MASQSSSVAASNPRKFAEKIALHTQKGAEETAEFKKIMAECAAVTSALRPGGIRPTQPLTNQTPRHLSPNFSSVPRHGSLPNVGMGVQLAARHGGMNSTQDFGANRIHSAAISIHPTTLQQIETSRLPSLSQINLGVSPNINTRRASSGSSGGHVTTCDTQSINRHIMQTTNSSSSNAINQSAGPIRHKSRIDTSPYRAERSDRYSTSSAVVTSVSYHHLSPPETWRRVHSDSAIHTALGNNGLQMAPNSSGAPSPGTNYSESGSQGASPPYSNEGRESFYGNAMDSTEQDVNSHIRYLGLPPKEGAEAKPGSLPDLTHCYVSSASPQENQGEDQASHYSSILSNLRTMQPVPQSNQQTTAAANSSPSSLSPTSNNIRLSDDEVSEILSIPKALLGPQVTGNRDEMVDYSDEGLDNRLNGRMNHDSNEDVLKQFCDSSSDILNSKGVPMDQQRTVIIDQHPPPYLQQFILDGNISCNEQKAEVYTASLLNYRNSHIIPPASSPIHLQGSPLERSTSPIDMRGSPHSPIQPTMGSPHWNIELTATQQQFQRCNMRDTSNYSGPGMYTPNDHQSNSYQQPMEFLSYLTESMKSGHLQGSYNQVQINSPNPQTPSSIPEIVLTDTDTFPRGFDDLELLSPEFRSDLGPLGQLDDTMIRLLAENETAITDPITEDLIVNENHQ